MNWLALLVAACWVNAICEAFVPPPPVISLTRVGGVGSRPTGAATRTARAVTQSRPGPVQASEDPTSEEDNEPTVRGDQVRLIIDNAKAFGSLQSDVRTLMENGASKEGLEGVQKDVSRIESTLGNCATKEAVAEIKAAVDNCATKEAVADVKDGITRVEQAVTNCATNEVVAGVKDDITRVEQAVNNCATKDAVASVKEAVNNCATKDAAANVQEAVGKSATKEDVDKCALRRDLIYQTLFLVFLHFIPKDSLSFLWAGFLNAAGK
eukprot:TRINITY_DN11568_c0_g1_i1.p1 TRINITY_DN11568_c0_g1~~TRINITY_DN11568_c0_g1_i1.p1  ORF type:complete len:267 (-),score=36.56 TRINITY_DN11568_c0_g1_i1:162-962(-)